MLKDAFNRVDTHSADQETRKSSMEELTRCLKEFSRELSAGPVTDDLIWLALETYPKMEFNHFQHTAQIDHAYKLALKKIIEEAPLFRMDIGKIQ